MNYEFLVLNYMVISFINSKSKIQNPKLIFFIALIFISFLFPCLGFSQTQNSKLKTHNLKFLFFGALLFFLLFLPFPVFSQTQNSKLKTQNSIDEPFTYPANWGGTGLMEIPTARIMRENSYRLGFSQVKPYRYYYGAISPLKGLEIDGRITEVLGVQGLANPEYGNFKDKAIDIKYQFLSEGKYMPAFALGIMDPHGTRVYPSQYIVASKQIYPFDFTLGFGNGRFGKRPLISRSDNLKIEMFSDTNEWIKDSQVFWGIQFAPSEKYALMFEYSPIKYHEQTSDPAQSDNFHGPVPSKYNFGLRYKPTKWSEIDLSYQRGDQFGISLSTAFDIGKPLIPIYDNIYREKSFDRRNPLQNRLVKALYNSGFSNIGVAVIDNDLWIEAQNENYLYATRAIGVILNILADINPKDINKIHIVLKENEIPVVELVTSRIDVMDLYTEKMTLNEFFSLSELHTDISGTPDISVEHRKLFNYGARPSLETFLNDPSGFFRYRLGLDGWVRYNLWKGASFVTGLATYPLNNITTTNEPLSIPVRTDIVEYKKKRIVLNRFLFDQIKRLDTRIYGKLSAGLLEIQYAGIDAEAAVPVLDGRILLGLSGSAVKKRAADSPFKLVKNDAKDIYTTAFINARLNIPETEMAIDVKAGRFLAGDNGIRFTVSKFINGVTVWVWYSLTDTSVFKDKFNRGYHDKGIGVSIPIRLFKGTDSRTSYTYALAPWTRDTGQDIDHFSTLFDFMGRNTKIFLDKDRQKMY